MDRFEAMRVFTRVARLGSFTGAARELELSTTAVSRYVSQLEDHLKTRLLQRTTRKLSLTAPGTAYLDKCERLLADLEELEEDLQEGQRIPRGRLRISAGVSFAQEQLSTLLPEFVARYDELEVELVLSDRFVDLVGDGIDVAVRIGSLPDSSLFAKRLAPCHHVLCASPAYLARHDSIHHPRDLQKHHCIIDRNQPRQWRFDGEEGPNTHSAEGRYIVNSAHAARDAVLAGLGLAYLPTFVTGGFIESGELVPQLVHYRAQQSSVYAVYPESRYLSSGVRAFIDTLSEAFGEEPRWDRWMHRPGHEA
ncbi:MAG: LysR family transcriptional regulator [Kofleriaceae bacterium]|nr:LysR family transcriptional regulator [Kofleriaceae bacterium]